MKKTQNQILLECRNISKEFIFGNKVFNNVDIKCNNRDLIIITGENGSGKSTLLKIIAGALTPSEGCVELSINDKLVKRNFHNKYFSFVAPYLSLYEEFTPVELISLHSGLKGISNNRREAVLILDKVGLSNYCDQIVKTFSSGMKQRMKYALALRDNSYIWLLDEPFANLDDAGINIVETLIKERISENKIVIIASNDAREQQHYNKKIEL